jgi:hypothetical protein
MASSSLIELLTHSFIDATNGFKEIRTKDDLTKTYQKYRGQMTNMHDNADSYRVFAALCHRSLLKRAMMEDDPVCIVVFFFASNLFS